MREIIIRVRVEERWKEKEGRIFLGLEGLFWESVLERCRMRGFDLGKVRCLFYFFNFFMQFPKEISNRTKASLCKLLTYLQLT